MSARALSGLLGAITLVVVVAGCSAKGSTVVESSSNVTSSSSPSASVDDGRVWDPNAWVPPVQIVLPQYSQAQLMQKRAAWLKTLEPEGAKVPDVKLVRWTHGIADQSTTLAKCLTDSGFPAVGDRGIRFPNPIPPSQEDAFLLAAYICNAKYTIDPKYVSNYTEDQLAVLYDYWDQYFIPCIRANGIKYDDSNKPTSEVFVSTFYAKPEDRWWPPDVFESVSQSRERQVIQSCPEMPPDKALYGG